MSLRHNGNHKGNLDGSLDAYLDDNPYQCLLLVLNHLADTIAKEQTLDKAMNDAKNYHLKYDRDYMPIEAK